MYSGHIVLGDIQNFLDIYNFTRINQKVPGRPHGFEKMGSSVRNLPGISGLISPKKNFKNSLEKEKKNRTLPKDRHGCCRWCECITKLSIMKHPVLRVILAPPEGEASQSVLWRHLGIFTYSVVVEVALT